MNRRREQGSEMKMKRYKRCLMRLNKVDNKFIIRNTTGGT